MKHQCSGNYFYGEHPALEKALQLTEGAYAAALREILTPGYVLTDVHRDLLRRFWLLQYMRTEAASRRAVEMAAEARTVIGVEGAEFNLSFREAVLIAMRTFINHMNAADDLKVCLLRNRTSVPFVTSDNPAVLSNRWYLEDTRTRWRSFGLQSAGDLLLLPLSPQVLCLGYDGNVYSVPHECGWVEVRHEADVKALNQHQFLNCRANIFVRDSMHARMVYDVYGEAAPLRPNTRHKIHYAVRDRGEGDSTRYRVVNPALEGNHHQEALIHTEAVHTRPSAWPRQLQWRRKGAVFTNATGIGYVRRAWVRLDVPFRQEATRA